MADGALEPSPCDPIRPGIANAHRSEPPLDLTVKDSADSWAARLRGRVLPTGTVRLVAHGPVARLPGYDEGAWWVQDAAAALPVRLLGAVEGLSIADLCAAPGGKTAQLAAAGARVTAVDRSPARVARLAENLARLELAAEIVVADALEWKAGRSMPSCSMPRARPPARSAAIPTSPVSSARTTSPRSPRCSSS